MAGWNRLSERQRLILRWVRRNPGASKLDIWQAFQDTGGARTRIYAGVLSLERKGYLRTGPRHPLSGGTGLGLYITPKGYAR